ncbi:hypothetical protein AB0O47_01990 [Streptomyces noursei]|uniref:hypothetical protein n=1 Tax=Streptomyces noursei TaxID=1971 RepID=UPI0022C40494|nr:hypothetical protein [Streptomyces noursei]
MANQAKVWDGSTWVDQHPKVWNGSAWVEQAPLYWDGQGWMSAAPAAREFAAFVGSSKGNYKASQYAPLPVPSGTRVNDFVVSLCANQSGLAKLVAPTGHLPQIISPATHGMSFAVACWPYTGRDECVVWDLVGSPQAACINLTYRGGDVTNQSVTPVSDMQLYQGVDKVPLMPSQDFTSVFVALAASRQVSSYAWPEGVLPRDAVVGRFGEYEVSAFVADTPGAGASLGALQLNTPAEATAMYLVTIPGKSDGRPTWILGDAEASVLGATTYLQ